MLEDSGLLACRYITSPTTVPNSLSRPTEELTLLTTIKPVHMCYDHGLHLGYEALHLLVDFLRGSSMPPM
jgi:hypothetical protein